MGIYVILDSMYKIGNSWDSYFDTESFSYLNNLFIKLDKEYESKIIYPKKDHIFKAFELTPLESVKVVIIGQDPYHGENEAHGLSFSVTNESTIKNSKTMHIKLPPSLRNIYKELESDLGIINNSGDLSNWAINGVFLLNSVLTVEKDKPASHKHIGWEKFTDDVIKILNDDNKPKVFILWGEYAKNKKILITNPKHLIIES